MSAIKEIKLMTREDLLSEATITEALDMPNKIDREIVFSNLHERASELRCARDFNRLLKTIQEVIKEEEARQRAQQIVDGITNFNGLETQYKCGRWVASDTGISLMSQNPFAAEIVACYHPIVPVERMRNIQTGEEQIKIKFHRRNEPWTEITVPKDIVSDKNKIIGLSKCGIAVNSGNSRLLVEYLSEVENQNFDIIPLNHSTSKLGWINYAGKEYFVPFRSDGIEFDGDARFRQIYQAIKEPAGDLNVWMNHVKKIRATKRFEPRIMMAASAASILLKPLGTLPFIIDLWGDTEGGKTVTLMLATSIWADPANNAYIGDYKSTDTALEAKADMLNSFPLVLDDSSKVSKRLREYMEGLIYDLCSGKGKSRSNKSLGINRENTWNCSVLTCGEKPLQEYVEQGGAINRIIEIECTDYLYDDPHETADIVKENYGLIGQNFAHAVYLLCQNEPQTLKDRYEKIFKQLSRKDKMQKQAHSMAVILLADQLLEEFFFQDGIKITVDEALDAMTKKDEVSDNQRAYEFILEKVAMNEERFKPNSEKGIEQWGYKDGDYVDFYTSALTKILKEESFGTKPLLTWLKKRGLLEADAGESRLSKKKWVPGSGNKTVRVYRIKIKDNTQDTKPDDYKQVELDDYDIPFNAMPF